MSKKEPEIDIVEEFCLQRRKIYEEVCNPEECQETYYIQVDLLLDEFYDYIRSKDREKVYLDNINLYASYFENIKLTELNETGKEILNKLHKKNMTQEELFLALAEGKKVRQTTWVDNLYIHFKDGKLITESGLFVCRINIESDWELYIETVTFFEALEAIKEGKRAKRIDDIRTIYFKEYEGINGGNLVSFKTKDIYNIDISDLDAKWQILEGEENE